MSDESDENGVIEIYWDEKLECLQTRIIPYTTNTMSCEQIEFVFSPTLKEDNGETLEA